MSFCPSQRAGSLTDLCTPRQRVGYYTDSLATSAPNSFRTERHFIATWLQFPYRCLQDLYLVVVDDALLVTLIATPVAKVFQLRPLSANVSHCDS